MTKFWWSRIMRWAKGWELCRREEGKEGGLFLSFLEGWYPGAGCQVGLATVIGFGLQFLLWREQEPRQVMMSLRMEEAEGIQTTWAPQVKKEFIWSCRVPCAMEGTVQVLPNHPIPFLHWLTSGFAALSGGGCTLGRCRSEFWPLLIDKNVLLDNNSCSFFFQ